MRITHSEAQSRRIARALARRLRAGQCVALHGELGAGKTQFVRGLVQGLGGNGRIVHSPTFVLLNVYPTPRMKVYHLDAYRVAAAGDFADIGFEELLDQNGLVVVEWAERVAAILPPQRVEVNIESLGKNQRRIRVTRCV